MPLPDEGLMQIMTVEDSLKTEEQTNHKNIKTYREYKNSDNKKQLGVKICDRHNFFKELEPELLAKCRGVIFNDTIFDMAEKVQLMLQALQLKYEIRDVDGIESQMKSFELVNADFDCYLLSNRSSIYNRVFDYLKVMLSI
jgi:R2D2